MNNPTSSKSVPILLKSIFERKIFIIVTTTIFVIVAVLIMLQQSEIYESEAILLIGKYKDLKDNVIYLENDKQIKMRLLTKYPTLSHVEHRGYGYLIIRATDITALETQNSLKEILKEILADHDKIYSKARTLYEKRLNYYRDQATSIKTNILSYSGPLRKQGGFTTEKEAINLIFYLQQIKSVGDRLDKIEENIFQHIQALTLDFLPTRVIKEPTLPLKPNRPKTLKYGVLSFVLGLLVSLFAAFCLAYRDYTLSLFKNSGSDPSY